jgi:hypothetical protein
MGRASMETETEARESAEETQPRFKLYDRHRCSETCLAGNAPRKHAPNPLCRAKRYGSCGSGRFSISARKVTAKSEGKSAFTSRPRRDVCKYFFLRANSLLSP